MNRIAVVGDNDSINAFSLCGVDVYLVENADNAANIIDDLAAKQFSIIFVVESIIKKIPDTILKYKHKAIPAITAISDNFPSSSSSYASNMLSDNVKKATGTDIFVNDMEDLA